ncbi:dihydroorotate dehydrogenase electron transfer subunit [Proteiniborus sp. MB09-C3]|uniref:dihydroorotate dehydrogenase electron transfer subunit n=1 Tax=Proteiniborus sp. MB09-C3 TaxID=3050072 RepID=UPI0025562B7D|nr:dihydroorotate dehydrogenase electron transfer subunit [Proteiniborus sp. MB09-C3]WIV11468.1 dihydroorotate dehydrogenase electron transfer subunit [Proteiniborus sp. MB09-C3]
MQSKHMKARIFENNEILEGIFKLTIKGGFEGKPGQFYMLRSWNKEPFLSRPISIHNLDKEKIEFLYEVRGEGTKLFSQLKRDEQIELLGPLGNGFDIEKIKGKVAIVTGGIGIAPMYYVAKQLEDCKVDFYAGFREQVYLIDEIKGAVNEIYVATDTGEIGHKGFITEIFDPKQYNIILSCGPSIMMDKVIKSCILNKKKIYISQENHMACGIGACLGCTCKTNSGMKTVCKDGPVFSGEDVIIHA